MRFDQKFVIAIAKLAGAHSTLHIMILSEGAKAYQLYRDNHGEVRATLEVLGEHLEISTATQFPATKSAWLDAKKSLSKDDTRRRKQTRKQLTDRYGLDAAELYDYSLLVSDYLWLKPMGNEDSIPPTVIDDIYKHSIDYGVDKKLIEQFLSEPTPDRSVEMLAAIVDYFNYVTWFISYSHEDAEFVDGLVDVIEMDQVRIWRDVKSMAAGDVLKASIREGIQRCDIFSVVLSSNSTQSEWVKWECGEAVGRQQAHGRPRIIPVILDNTKIPAVLSNYRAANFSVNFEEGMKGIIEAIRVSNGLTT